MENIVGLIPAFLLIFIRILTYFLVIPVFSYRAVPVATRIGLAFFLAYTMVFTVEIGRISFEDDLYILLLVKEVLTGLALGLFGYIIFSAIQTAGGFMDFQMGFAIANVIDPQTGAQSPILGQFLYIFAILFLFSVNGHHLLIDGIYHSYQFIPLESLSLAFGENSTIMLITKAFAAMFVVSFQISIPIVGSIFLVDLALGLVARTVPQINIFIVGLPVKILVSFILLFFVVGSMIFSVRDLFELLLYSLRDFMKILGQ